MTDVMLDGERLARAALTFLAEPADLRLGALVTENGAAATLDAIQRGLLPDIPGPDGTAMPQHSAGRVALERALERWRTRLAEVPTVDDLAQFFERGIRLVCPGEPEWPSTLQGLGYAQPYALWLRGNADLRFSCLRSVAVVGSRAATAYGSYVASELASSIAARGWTIVSGAAYGVDAAAHRGALGAGAATVAVLACGVDTAYPAGHKDLLDAVAEAGVVVSEWPPGRNPTRLRFLIRNRVIAALSVGTLVVEAGERSGALNTARHARDLGRMLMAVPGPVTSQQSAGCHRIIRDWQGTLVTNAADVLEMVGRLGSEELSETAAESAGSIAGRRPEPVLPRDALDLESATVLDALPVRGGIGTAAVARQAGVDLGTVVRCLGALAAGGFAERCEGGWRVRRP
jgi:DNA processing protein